jgi:hypothetical protein
MASVMFGVIKFFIRHFLSYVAAVARSLALSSGPACPAFTTLWTATAGGVRVTDELSPAAYALRCTALPEGRVSAPGPEVFAY